jgi:hypothetical protein
MIFIVVVNRIRADVPSIAGQPMFRVVHPHVQQDEFSRSQVSIGLCHVNFAHVPLHASYVQSFLTDTDHHYSSVLLLSRAYCNMGDLKQMRGDVEGARRCVLRVVYFCISIFILLCARAFHFQELLLRC